MSMEIDQIELDFLQGTGQMIVNHLYKIKAGSIVKLFSQRVHLNFFRRRRCFDEWSGFF